MTKVAIPVFHNRVSPVLDTCKHIRVIHIKNGSEVSRENVFLGDMPLNERCRIFEKLGVSVIICGGISETFGKILKHTQLQIVNGISGDVQKVLSAYIDGNLDNKEFYMPGFKANDKKQ
jgi:predicted Fe-Mo cluster-binding NifX family protein